MSKIAYLTNLFEYNLFASTQLLTQLVNNESAQTEKALKLAAHILNAQTIWNSRMMGVPQPFGPWQIQQPTTFLATMKREHELSLHIINTKNLQDTLTYTNSLGNTYTNTFEDVLIHIVNHCTYHRAQIATEIKQAGIAPAVTDYIAYKR